MTYITFKDYPGKKYRCSVRLVRICQDNDISRLADFTKMTINDLQRVPECGKTTALFVRGILRENGLDFLEKSNINGNKDLGKRNKQIVELVSKGQSYKKVSEKVGISPKRVQQIYQARPSCSKAIV